VRIIKTGFLTAGLVFIDQIIKRVIAHTCFQSRIPIMGEWVQFMPVVNRKMSWAGNFIPLFSQRSFTILFNILSLFISVNVFCYLNAHKSWGSHKKLYIGFVMFWAGAIASILDRVLWGGSLDYIYLQHLFVFDLKDCYITITEILTVYYGIRYAGDINGRGYLRWNLEHIKKAWKGGC